MFRFEEPSCSTWVPSHHNNTKKLSIPRELIENLEAFDILGIDHLYQNYKSSFKGAILNEEPGFNMHLQVSAFLKVMFTEVEQMFLVLVLCPDKFILNWHYHLSVHGEFQVQIVTPKTCPSDFDQEHGLVLLLSFSNIKLANALVEYSFFSVVIDHFDDIATKLVIRKLKGDFNIGLSQRNFFTNLHQKLQWTMLNWTNPGCVGKLKEFYRNDNDNFANLRDNYHHWWLTLTWKFCDNFKEPSESDNMHYSEVLTDWAVANNLLDAKNHCNKIKKCKDLKIHVKRHSSTIENFDRDTNELHVDSESNSKKEEAKDICISKPVAMINEPTVLELNEEHEKSECGESYEDDIISSIIDSSETLKPFVTTEDSKIKVTIKKNELMSEIFDDNPCTPETLWQSEDGDSDDFFSSLI